MKKNFPQIPKIRLKQKAANFSKSETKRPVRQYKKQTKPFNLKITQRLKQQRAQRQKIQITQFLQRRKQQTLRVKSKPLQSQKLNPSQRRPSQRRNRRLFTITSNRVPLYLRPVKRKSNLEEDYMPKVQRKKPLTKEEIAEQVRKLTQRKVKSRKITFRQRKNLQGQIIKQKNKVPNYNLKARPMECHRCKMCLMFEKKYSTACPGMRREMSRKIIKPIPLTKPLQKPQIKQKKISIKLFGGRKLNTTRPKMQVKQKFIEKGNGILQEKSKQAKNQKEEKKEVKKQIMQRVYKTKGNEAFRISQWEKELLDDNIVMRKSVEKKDDKKEAKKEKFQIVNGIYVPIGD